MGSYGLNMFDRLPRALMYIDTTIVRQYFLCNARETRKK